MHFMCFARDWEIIAFVLGNGNEMNKLFLIKSENT